MRIAILGATSQIAQDFIQSVRGRAPLDFGLFARQPDVVRERLAGASFCRPPVIGDFASFMSQTDPFDAVVNFIGSGNPAATARIGASILDVTHEFDSLAVEYIRNYPGCRYIFFSSGAVYGRGFLEPADENTNALVAVNNLEPTDWYGLAKLYAECRHRALSNLPIVDVRIFNYFSASLDIEARFLITDMLRAIMHGDVFQTSRENIMRDYVGPSEICELVLRVLESPPMNVAVDCFTKAPIDKISMLGVMESEFGLSYELVDNQTGLSATGAKVNYYSSSRKATKLFGYVPHSTSLEVILEQSRQVLAYTT